MRRSLLPLSIMALMLMLNLSCLFGSRPPENRIMIRIRNDSQFDIDDFWLGAGPRGGATENTAYGAIRSGQTTSYKSVEPVLANYRKMNLVANGHRYFDTIDPAAHLGRAELETGQYYTFAYDLDGDQAHLTLLHDAPPE